MGKDTKGKDIKKIELDEIEALKAENEQLKTKNAKLYRDCVSFAKKIKANEKKLARMNELESEIAELKEKIKILEASKVKNSDKYDTAAIVSSITGKRNAEDDKTNTSVLNSIYIMDEQDDNISESEDEVAYDPQMPLSYEPESDDSETPKNHAVEKKSGAGVLFKTLFGVVFALSFLVLVISGITYLFCTTYADHALLGYRFYTVYNNAMYPDVSKNDVVLVKCGGFDGIELDSLVLTSKDTRSIARLVGFAVDDDLYMASVQDKKTKYTVTEDEFFGKIDLTIPNIGSVVRYASANKFNYVSIVSSITIISLAGFLLIPSKKKKSPKFGKDYTVEDFTI